MQLLVNEKTAKEKAAHNKFKKKSTFQDMCLKTTRLDCAKEGEPPNMPDRRPPSANAEGCMSITTTKADERTLLCLLMRVRVSAWACVCVCV